MKRFNKLLAYLLTCSLTFSAIFTYPANLFAQDNVNIVKSGAWAEMAYVNFSPYQGADDYNVYYKSTGDYVKIDDELVRIDPDNTALWRADILGLPGNITYTVKVVPIVAGSELETASSTVSLTPFKADRTGFAFTDGNYTTGGYNRDGSVPENANIVYITPENHATVTLEGADGVVGFTKLLEYLRKNADTVGPTILRFIGDFTTLQGISAKMYKVKQLKNVTFEGVGNSGMTGIGFEITGTEDTWLTQNIEIKNLYFKDYGDDGISLVFGATGVWIHHNYFGAGHDGACDVKRGSSYITISDNICEGANKAMLCGHDDEKGLTEDIGKLKVTYHHNHFKSTTQRNPRVRFGNVHVFNNYYTNTKSYCVASACDAQVLVEGNFFENANRPYIVSQQGNALDKDGKNLLTQSGPGLLKAQNNVLQGCNYNNDLTDTKTEGFNFDPSDSYSYTLQTPQQAVERILKYSGTVVQADGQGSIIDEPTTEKPTEVITEKPTEIITEKPTEIITEKPTEITTQNPVEIIYGDVNNDGVITSADAAQVLSHVLNSDGYAFNDFQKKSADVNNDGIISASDSANILSKVLNGDFMFLV